MSENYLTINENGEPLTETVEGITMPIDYSFEKVNDWIHGIDVQFEEIQALALGMANHVEQLQATNKELVVVCERLLEAVPYVSDYDVPIGLWDDIKQALSKAIGDVNE